MSERIPREKFEENVDTIFTAVWDTADPLELRLIRVRRIMETERNLQFAVEFLGDPERVLRQGTQRLVHPAVGENDIFLTPISNDAKGYVYEAVFNYLIKPVETDVAAD